MVQWSADELFETNASWFGDYDISKYDVQSIEEIRKKIKNNSYITKAEAKEHLDFLENLANKLREIVVKEKNKGLGAWDVEKFLGQIKGVYDMLWNVYISLPAKEIISSKKKKPSAGIHGRGAGSFKQRF